MITLFGPRAFTYGSGRPAVRERLTVLRRSNGAPATLYADETLTPLANPVMTDSLGNAYFWIEEGLYDIVVRGQTVQIAVDAPDQGGGGDFEAALLQHINHPTPHKAYDVDIPDLVVFFENGLA